MKSEGFIAHRVEEGEPRTVFQARFERCRTLLHFIACRVLGDDEGAADAVQNCFVTASRNLPAFESEGAFRCWLLRVLIDEALLILLQRRERSLIARDPNIGRSYRELEAS